jgi:hypothetical protein
MNKELWDKAVAFHGHECPGLAIGFKACEAAAEKIGIGVSDDEEIVCITENDACGVDAIQALLSCTLGKGNLLYHGTGKQAFSFFDRKNNKKLRVCLKPGKNEDMDRTQWERVSFKRSGWTILLLFQSRNWICRRKLSCLIPSYARFAATALPSIRCAYRTVKRYAPTALGVIAEAGNKQGEECGNEKNCGDNFDYYAYSLRICRL